ncbi:hypothetical protein TNCV_2045561 [Trichonephila clavipes]|uniref:Uncharacterized protein n=1 Tax=Trichonephila clavipes TaxID=2585209 RepID=A0A8X6SQM2_TRICX|nr:hypothetical protein TNCV_2045561 [Trichonephila clavipes]
MSNGSWNAECAVCPPFNKVAAMPEDAITNAIFCWLYFHKAAPESLVVIGNKNMDAGLRTQSDLTSFQQYQEKLREFLKLESRCSFPEMHLVPTFGAPARFVPEGTGSTIVQQSSFSFLSLILDSRSPSRKTLGAHFAHSKNFKVSPCHSSFKIVSSGII